MLFFYIDLCLLCLQAEGINVNPLYLMLPATIAASMAFMLPVATPPNAIVFSYGHLRVIDMVLDNSFTVLLYICLRKLNLLVLFIEKLIMKQNWLEITKAFYFLILISYFQAIAGFLMNILCIFVITLGAHTWGMALFDLDTVPWATNSTYTTTASP